MGIVVAVVLWLVSAMTAWVPTSQHVYLKESAADANVRYNSIASDALQVAFDPNEAPLFKDPKGQARIRTALLLIAIARHESTYVKRVEEGHCLKGECDNGFAHCLMQVHTEGGGLVLDSDTYSFAKDHTKEWREANKAKILTKASLIEDRKVCFKAALHKLRESFRICRGMPVEDRMGIYTGEGCRFEDKKPKPNPKSRLRVRTALNFMAGHPMSVTDDELAEELAKKGVVLTLLDGR